MKRSVFAAILAILILLPAMASAQAPAQTPASPQAEMQCTPGPGGTCVVPGAEQKQPTPGKMAQGCCMMQESQGCPRCQAVQKQLDDLRQRVEALEGKAKGKKK